MQIRIYKDGEQRGPYTEAEVARFIKNGAYDKHDLGFTARYGKWLPLSELVNPSPELEAVSAKSSAVKAGWICLILGLCTFWLLGFGFLFFVATFILSIVAMCTNQMKHGIALITSTVFASAICYVMFMMLIFGSSVALARKLSGGIQPYSPQNYQTITTASQPTPQPITFTPQAPPPVQTQVVNPAPQTSTAQQQYEDGQKAHRQAENERLQRLQDQQMANAREETAKKEQKQQEWNQQQRYDQLKRDWENKYHRPYPFAPPY